MTQTTPLHGTEAPLATTGLQGLANGVFWQSSIIDFSGDIAGNLEIILGTTTTVGSVIGLCNVYLAGSIDGVNFDGGAVGGDATYAPSPSAADQVRNASYLGVVSMKADESIARIYRRIIGLPDMSVMGPILPPFGIIIIENATGAALSASGNEVNYRPATLQNV